MGDRATNQQRLLKQLQEMPDDGRYTIAISMKAKTLRYVIEHMVAPHGLPTGVVLASLIDQIVKDDARAHATDVKPRIRVKANAQLA